MVIGLLALVFARAAEAPDKIEFVRDVQPILVAHCYQCHGVVTQKAKMRWDRRDSILGRKEPVLVAGKASESQIIKLITTTDPEEIMPPKGKGEPLTAGEVAVLRAWIDQGAVWPDEAAVGPDPRMNHWSFKKPLRMPPPEVKHTGWARNEIDRFVLARLEAEGLAPSPEANRYALIRRASLDLTGLPPTLKQVDAFINDKSADAYEKLVDRLLQSPAYGERWAQVWLDLARYADSRGYANDSPRTIWRYRDWVIGAINSNMPFDQFTVEQLAGDLLPNPTRDQLLATAFHRNTLTNDEGGTDDEEFRVAAVVDRVNTTTQVFMGMTAGCAQCHDHKYDPISQEEYFKLFAIFNNTEDSDKSNESPVYLTPLPQFQKEAEKLEGEVAALDKQLTGPNAQVDAEQKRWERELRRAPRWYAIAPGEALSKEGATTAIQPDGSVLVSGAVPENDIYTVRAASPLRTITALRLEVLTDKSLPSEGPGRAENGNFVLSRLGVGVNLLDPEGGPPRTIPLKIALAFSDFSQKDFEIGSLIENADVKKRGWSIEGQTSKPHYGVFILDEPISNFDGATLTLTLEHQSERLRQTLGRFRISVTDDPDIFKKADAPPEVLAVLDVQSDKRTQQQNDQITKYFRSTLSAAMRPLNEKLAALRKELAPKLVETPVMRELAAEKRRKTNILLRGNYLEKGAEVSAGVPAVLPQLPKDLPANRLTFAKWLVGPENPLTARVIVNRYWEQLFGLGLVETSDDFGLRGATPSHPQLFDWLASELMRRQWDTKQLVRLMVTSATYRQSTRITPQLLERDPRNRLLARGPRFRSAAEVIRDEALAAAGLLSQKMYGPPVRPPQPKLGLKAAFGGSTDWQSSTGEDKYRRGLYTSWRRTTPYPSMVAFDAPNRNVCTLKRPRTNTPLQALVTMNDPVYVEAAQALARRMMIEGGDDTESRARYGFQLCLSRPPGTAEVRRLVGMFEEARSRYLANPKAAVPMATDPLGPLPKEVEPADAAAWTVVGNVLLNLDEMFSKR